MAGEPTDLFAQQAANRRKSAWLVAGFVAFFAWLGFGGDYALWLGSRHADGSGGTYTFPWIGTIATLVAGGIAWSSLRSGAKRVLWATGAREITEPATPGERVLVNVVEEMAIASGMPKPRTWIVPDPDPNAFATGTQPGDAHVAVTEGLLRLLSRDELQGVVAHEFAHIRNLDVRLMTLIAAMMGAIALLSDGLGRFLRHGGRLGGGGSRRSDSKGGGGNPLAIVVLVLWVVTLLLAPVITRLLAMAVSRKREFLADATAAQLTRNPLALADALAKLEGELAATKRITRGAAHLCIVDPGERKLSEKAGLTGDVFASHPPLRERVRRLQAMGYQFAKQDASQGSVTAG